MTISDLAPASGSGSAKASLLPLDVVSDVINDTLEKEGIDDVTYGSPEVTQTTEPTGGTVDQNKVLNDISTDVQDAFADALKDGTFQDNVISAQAGSGTPTQKVALETSIVLSEPVSDEYLEVLTKAFQDSIEGVIVIGSSVVEVEVDGETKYKVVFELEATEETVEAAQEEEEITRINNSLVLPVSSTQTTTTRIESSVFIPVSSTGSADGVVQALIDAIEDQGIEVESFTFDPETGELSYVVKIVNYAGSGSQSLENTIEGALEHTLLLSSAGKIITNGAFYSRVRQFWRK